MAIEIENLPPMLTAAEYADLARVRVKTVWDWHWQGKGPQPVKVGRSLRYRKDAVLRHLGLAPAQDEPATAEAG